MTMLESSTPEEVITVDNIQSNIEKAFQRKYDLYCAFKSEQATISQVDFAAGSYLVSVGYDHAGDETGPNFFFAYHLEGDYQNSQSAYTMEELLTCMDHIFQCDEDFLNDLVYNREEDMMMQD